MGASNLLIEEAARLIERLEMRLQQERARLTYPSPDSEAVTRVAHRIARMEEGLDRLRLYSEMLTVGSGRHDDRLINERNNFAKQYNRKWRPSQKIGRSDSG